MSVANIFQRKQKWVLLEMLEEATHILTHEFFIIMPFNIGRIRFYMLFIVENLFLLVVILAYYYLLAFKLQIQTRLLYTSYYIVNMTSLTFTTEYVFFVLTVKRQAWIVNSIMQQLLFGSVENKLDDLEVKTPTIAYNEIFSIYKQPMEEKKQTKSKQNLIKTVDSGSNLFHQIRLFFRPLNEYNINVVKQRVGQHSLSSEIVLFIDRISSLHYTACEIIVLINRVYSFQLMLHFAAMFLFLVFGIFALYKAFNVTSIGFQLIAAANGFWIVYYMVTILIIIYSTSSTVELMHTSGDIVHQIIRSKQKTFSDNIIEKLSTLGLQIKMRDVTFSCGLFHFDWSLFASILAAIVMYLVFLIQFDVSPSQISTNSTVK